jgi:pimeloyl-ACP methyl ester carboxylesterase
MRGEEDMTPSPTPDRRDVLKTATRLAAASSLAGLAGSTAAAGDLSQTSHGDGKTNKPTQRIIETNGIRLNIAEQSNGPMVLLCHGFPECWYSWRHQIDALATAGFHAVAPDMRGYGKSDRPEAIDQYTIFHLVGDMVGVLDAFEAPTAVIIGHDWGAGVAWHAALMRPDRFRAVVALSVPFRPRGKARPTSIMPQTEDAQFYQLYFQQPGIAEAEFERDPRSAVRRMLYGLSGDATRRRGASTETSISMVPRGGGFLGGMAGPAALPDWLNERDVDFYADEFKRSGFRGPLNYYRNIDRNWELMAPYAGARVMIPALFVAGDCDLSVKFPGTDQLLANFKQFVPTLRAKVMLPGCGHLAQQERPNEVNAAILDFVRGLPT